jgi:hypothetical protein
MPLLVERRVGHAIARGVDSLDHQLHKPLPRVRAAPRQRVLSQILTDQLLGTVGQLGLQVVHVGPRACRGEGVRAHCKSDHRDVMSPSFVQLQQAPRPREHARGAEEHDHLRLQHALLEDLLQVDQVIRVDEDIRLGHCLKVLLQIARVCGGCHAKGARGGVSGCYHIGSVVRRAVTDPPSCSGKGKLSTSRWARAA